MSNTWNSKLLDKKFTDEEVATNRQTFLAALRDEEKYPQARARLRRDGCFCVAGVLCDVSNLGKWAEAYGLSQTASWFYTINGVKFVTAPPEIVRRWAGMDSNLMDHAMTWNDDRDIPLPRIADMLEEVWSGRVEIDHYDYDNLAK